jgi:hypothetical protein
MTPTREDLLRLAACFEAMDWSSAARDARDAAASLPAPDVGARPFAVGDRVRVAEGAWMREGQTGTVEERDPDDPQAEYRVRFNPGAAAWFPAGNLIPTNAPAVEAQGGALSEADADHLAWFAGQILNPADAACLQAISKRIRTTLANGAGEVERLRAELDEARRERDGALGDARIEKERAGRLFDSLNEWISWGVGHVAHQWTTHKEMRAAIDARLAAVKADRNEPCGLTLHHKQRDEVCRRCGREAGDHPNYLGPDWVESTDAHYAEELRKKVQEARDAARDGGMVYAHHLTITELADKLAEVRRELAAAKAGAGVTKRDVWLLHEAAALLESSADINSDLLNGLADRLSQVVQSREETGR